MSRIIVTARTRDEEHNVDKFCSRYAWADKILLADGGSVDRTKGLALRFPNVEVREFNERVEMENGYWRNPHGKHINFLIQWAEDEGADWIIFDDFDSAPNNSKMKDVLLAERFGDDYIQMTRLYLWGLDKYFPEMSQDKKGNWTHALWAWRADKKLRYKEDDPTSQEYVSVPSENILNVNPEFSCLLHYSWINEQRVNEKLKFYRESGQIPNMQHPLEFAGRLEKLPEWAKCDCF